MNGTFAQAGIERRWQAAQAPSTLVMGVLGAMLASCLFLTRFALTVGKSELSLALVVVLIGTVALALTGAVRISPVRAVLFAIATAMLLLSVMLGGAVEPSYASFLNLILLYACWMFVVP